MRCNLIPGSDLIKLVARFPTVQLIMTHSCPCLAILARNCKYILAGESRAGDCVLGARLREHRSRPALILRHQGVAGSSSSHRCHVSMDSLDISLHEQLPIRDYNRLGRFSPFSSYSVTYVSMHLIPVFVALHVRARVVLRAGTKQQACLGAGCSSSSQRPGRAFKRAGCWSSKASLAT